MSTAVLILFSFANVFGPWICCCTTGAIIAKPVIEKTQAEPECEHCPSCKKKPKPEEKPVEKHPVKNCPCEARPHIEMTVADGKVNTILATISLPPLPAMLTTNELTTFRPAIRTDAARGPLLTAQMKLFGHHVLRC